MRGLCWTRSSSKSAGGNAPRHENVVRANEEAASEGLRDLARGTAQETLNALLDKEDALLAGIVRYGLKRRQASLQEMSGASASRSPRQGRRPPKCLN